MNLFLNLIKIYVSFDVYLDYLCFSGYWELELLFMLEFFDVVIVLSAIFSMGMPSFVIYLIVTQSPKTINEYKKFLIHFTVRVLLVCSIYSNELFYDSFRCTTLSLPLVGEFSLEEKVSTP